MIRVFVLIGGALLLAGGMSASGQNDAFEIPAEALATAQQLIDRGKSSDLAYDIVESLTTDIGPRLAGSDDEARARGWGARLGEELGFDRVSIEEFSMPFWERGESRLTMSSPYELELHATALGGSGTSDGSFDAQVVYFRSVYDLSKAADESLAGKIAFVDGEPLVKSQTGAGYGPANQRRRMGWQHAERAGARALVVRSVGSSSHRFAHTGICAQLCSGSATGSAAWTRALIMPVWAIR